MSKLRKLELNQDSTLFRNIKTRLFRLSGGQTYLNLNSTLNVFWGFPLY